MSKLKVQHETDKEVIVLLNPHNNVTFERLASQREHWEYGLIISLRRKPFVTLTFVQCALRCTVTK